MGNDGSNSGRWIFGGDNPVIPPSSGEFVTNGSTLGGTTQFNINIIGSSSADYTSWFQIIDANLNNSQTGYLQVTEVGNNSIIAIYEINGVSDNTTYWEFSVTNIVNNGSFSNNPYTISYVFDGTNGAQGPQGPASNVSGPQGPQGPQGVASNTASGLNLSLATANALYRVVLVDETGTTSETPYVDSNDGLTFNPSTNVLNVKGDVIAYFSSDENLKENITPIQNVFEKLEKINGYEFDWKSEANHEGHDIGVIAQEIEQVLPEIVTLRDNGYKAVRYDRLVAFLISVAKEQQKQIEELKSKIG
jgi:hypothetical protein